MPYGGNKKNNHISKKLNRKTFHSTYIKKDRSSFLKKQNNQRNLRRKAKKHLKEYNHYNRRLNKGQEKDKSLKGISMELMEIIEEINEKGINDNTYLNSMNLLQKVHNYKEKEERQPYILPRHYTYHPQRTMNMSYTSSYTTDINSRLSSIISGPRTVRSDVVWGVSNRNLRLHPHAGSPP